MKNPAEEKKARSSMSSTFGSVMNPDASNLKLSLDQILKQRSRGAGVDSDDEHVDITQEMIFKEAMTSEYSKIDSLQLMSLRLSSLTTGSGFLRKMTNLKDLNLSNNKLSDVAALNELKGLQSLVLNSNRILEVSSLSLPVLTSLSLDRNQIKSIKGFRGVKKLEELSLEANKITDASMSDIGYQLLNLNELNLRGNQITQLRKVIGYPHLKSLILDKNPITSIDSNSFAALSELFSLSICRIQLPNYKGDLLFLRHCTNLEELRMSSCFVQRDLADLSAFPDLYAMKKFVMRDVGLIRTTDLHFKMPILELLDLQDNRIYEVEAIDDLSNFTSLVEVNFANNPVNVHANLKQMIQDANPLLEIINKRQVQDIGHREQTEIKKLRQEIIEYEQPTIGTTAGDRLLAEGHEDADMEVQDLRRQIAKIDRENEQARKEDLDQKLKFSKQKNELLQKVDEALQRKNDEAIMNFERNQHMRLKFLCSDAPEDAKEAEEKGMTLDEMYSADARKFKDQIKQQFVDYRSKFRQVMKEVRTTHYDSFIKVGLDKESATAAVQGGQSSSRSVYSQIDEEVKQLKERLRAAGVNRIVAGIDAAGESEYDSEDPEDEDKEKPAKETVQAPQQSEHVPKIGASGGKEASRIDRGGIPKPVGLKNNFVAESQEILADVLPMRKSGRDFRIMANSSRGSFGGISGAESNQAKPLNRLPKQRPHLIGANKPHMLKNQNEQLRQMLGGKLDSKPTLEPIDPSKVRSMRQNSVRASQSSLKGDSRGLGGATPSLQSSGKFDQFSSTPGKKRTDTMRQSGRSVGKFGHTKMGSSTSNFDGKSMKSGSVRDPKEDSFDLEDFDEIVEKIQLESAIHEKKRNINQVLKKDDEDYKDSFLIKFFENQGEAFNWDGSDRGNSLERPAKSTRIAKPPTQEEVKKNQQRLHQDAVAAQLTSPQASPQKQFKSILGQTNGNDDQWYPAWGTSSGAGATLEEDKNQGKAPLKKPMAFTEEPASNNQKLMDFEAQLLIKAGKKPPVQAPVPQPTTTSQTTVASQHQISTSVDQGSTSAAQSQEDEQPKVKPRFKVGIPRTQKVRKV